MNIKNIIQQHSFLVRQNTKQQRYYYTGGRQQNTDLLQLFFSHKMIVSDIYSSHQLFPVFFFYFLTHNLLLNGYITEKIKINRGISSSQHYMSR